MFKEISNEKESYLSFVSPLQTEEALEYLETTLKKKIHDWDLIWCRFFISPSLDQELFFKSPFINSLQQKNKASFIIQKPELGNFSALFSFVKKGLFPIRQFETGYELHGKNYHYFYLNNLQSEESDIHTASAQVFSQMDALAHEQGYLPREHLLRTWLFLPQLFKDYAGMVEERNNYFKKIERTEASGFPASTGIEGTPLSQSPLSLDALLLKKVKREQLKELEAPGFMPTAFSYGVAFARGWKVTFGDREHYYLSGTASIDETGQIIHTDDIKTQCLRALQNFEQLLVREEASLGNLSYVIAYVKDEEQIKVCSQFFNEHLPQDLPLIVVRASVCRPGWLIEIEGFATKISQNHFPTWE